ncbi:MAG: type I-E CRISPR-associated protein Cas5/CasD, partial [Thiolinea sp.]
SDRPEYSLSELQTALQAPHFHLYLGRKSCPLSIPLRASVVSAPSLKGALDGYAIDGELSKQIDDKACALYYWEQTEGLISGVESSYTVPRYDQPLNRTRWQFVARDEYVSLAEGGE